MTLGRWASAEGNWRGLSVEMRSEVLLLRKAPNRVRLRLKPIKHFRRNPFSLDPFWPFTMLRAGPGTNRRTGINLLVAGRTVGQS